MMKELEKAWLRFALAKPVSKTLGYASRWLSLLDYASRWLSVHTHHHPGLVTRRLELKARIFKMGFKHRLEAFIVWIACAWL